jgi:hypothetical protein
VRSLADAVANVAIQRKTRNLHQIRPVAIDGKVRKKLKITHNNFFVFQSSYFALSPYLGERRSPARERRPAPVRRADPANVTVTVRATL